MSNTHFSGPVYSTNGFISGTDDNVLTGSDAESITATAAEIDVLAGVTAGTATASKAVVLGASKEIATITTGTITNLTTTTLTLGSTALASTATEIDKQCDISAQTETIDSGVAASLTKRITKVDNTTSGAGAITLAAPGAANLGLVKVIEMVVDNGDVTLALTNVVGGSAATTATFGAVNDALILVGGTNKWHVVAESGVVLS